MDSIRLYFKSCRMQMRCQFQYRASFFLQSLSQLVMLATELVSVLLLLDRFTHLGQWQPGDILFFFGFISIPFYLCEAFVRGITNFQPLVAQGTLDTFLIRPRALLFQVVCSEADPRRFTAILVGVFALALGTSVAQVQWTLLKALLLLWSVLGSMALVLGLFLIEATLTFFSVKSIEAVNTLTYGGRSTCQYPIDIYPRGIQVLFTLIAPFALTTHMPAAYILDKPLWNTGALAAFAAPLAGYVFLGLMVVVFYMGLRHYRSTGS